MTRAANKASGHNRINLTVELKERVTGAKIPVKDRGIGKLGLGSRSSSEISPFTSSGFRILWIKVTSWESKKRSHAQNCRGTFLPLKSCCPKKNVRIYPQKALISKLVH